MVRREVGGSFMVAYFATPDLYDPPTKKCIGESDLYSKPVGGTPPDQEFMVFNNQRHPVTLWGTMAYLVVVSVFLGCGSSERSLEQGREFRSRRQFDEAIACFQRVLKHHPDNPEAIVEMAKTFRDAHEWKDAQIWWNRVLAQKPENPEALKGLWQSQWEPADSIAHDSLKGAISQDLKHRLPSAQNRSGMLSLAVDIYAMTNDSAEAVIVRKNLITEFPKSQKAYDILGEQFWDGLYPIWNSPEAQITYLLNFIHDQQEPLWRRTAYQWLLNALHQTGRDDSLVTFCKTFANVYSDDPFALTSAARWLYEVKKEIPLAWKYAQKAVELERVAIRPDVFPPEQWKLEKANLFGGSRLILAQTYREQGYRDHAEKWLRSAIEDAPYTMDDDMFPTAHWEVLAEIIMDKQSCQEAFSAAIQAMVGGDRRNYWSHLADSVLVEVCEKTGRDPENRMQLARETMNYQRPIFTDVTASTGLGERHESRVAWGDVNNDGYDDLLLNGCVLFINQGDGAFRNGTEAARLKGPANGGVFGDYDNDGFLDFYAISSGTGDKADRLWRNLGEGTFEDVTVAAGNVRDDYPSEGAAWGDLNNDGFLDLYIANYEKPGTELAQGTPDRFYLNQGNGTFREVSHSVGMIPPFGKPLCGRGVNWGDYNNDGNLDIYVSNYRLQENLLWKNLGNCRVTGADLQAGVAGVEKEGWWGHTIGSEWGDYDNDGDLDLITANLAHPRYIDFSNKTFLYENQGAPNWTFVDRRAQAGIKYDECQSDPAWGDVDNDGFLDLYITCIYENMRSYLYRNKGDGTFEDVTYLSGTRAFNGWGCAFSDYDNDGDLDLVVGSGSGVKLFRNDSPIRHWFQVKVVGTTSNKSGIGARVEAVQEKLRQIREIEGGKGTTSQHSLVAHFGLGNQSAPVQVTIRFPSGASRLIKNVTVDQRIEVVE
jgi:tetratricopeptide (TPR) repeat protein